MVAGEDGEDAVKAGHLVDGEGEGDEFGRGTEGDEVEEGLERPASVHMLSRVSYAWFPDSYPRSWKSQQGGRHNGQTEVVACAQSMST